MNFNFFIYFFPGERPRNTYVCVLMCIYVCAYMSVNYICWCRGVCVCTRTCMPVHVSTGIFGGQKESDPFEVSYG